MRALKKKKNTFLPDHVTELNGTRPFPTIHCSVMTSFPMKEEGPDHAGQNLRELWRNDLRHHLGKLHLHALSLDEGAETVKVDLLHYLRTHTHTSDANFSTLSHTHTTHTFHQCCICRIRPEHVRVIPGSDKVRCVYLSDGTASDNQLIILQNSYLLSDIYRKKWNGLDYFSI